MTGIVGPTFADLEQLDMAGRRAVIATAFYSRAALRKVKVDARELRLLVRLDLESPDEWKRGMIDPEALLEFMIRHQQAGCRVDLRIRDIAHAKAYVGRNGFLMGSANLAVRGFLGVGHEMLWREQSAARRNLLLHSLATYAAGMQPLENARLQAYIDAHRADVQRYRRRNPLRFRRTDEDRPDPEAPKAPRHGSYGDFLDWLARRPEPAAQVIWERGMGVSGNLSGHIHSHFYGFRQWFLFDPDMLAWAAGQNPDTYVLRKWSLEETRLREFVVNHAGDEPDFSLHTWQSYLHVEAGGRAGGQASSGNMKRMIPLIARYLEEHRD